MTGNDEDRVPAGRSIRLEVEVPGTPEQVWEAIATGHGITAWFVPTEVEPRPGGRIRQNFGAGMQVEGTVTAFDPPHRFAYGADEAAGPGLAFEFLVEARDGGTCVVRLVNSGFSTGEEWDDQYDGMTEGWKLFLHNLRLHRIYFPGQRAVSVIINGFAQGPRPEVWTSLLDKLGLTDPIEGGRVETGPPAPRLAGTIDRLSPGMLTFLLDDPAPGVGFIAAEGSGPVAVSTYLYLYGDEASRAAERQRDHWQAWMDAQYPAP